MKKYGLYLLLITLTILMPLHSPSRADAAFGDYLFEWSAASDWYPVGLEVDAVGDIYVVDAVHHKIQVFDYVGAFKREWGSMGTGDGQFYYPYDLALDAVGNVYAVEGENHRIQVFDNYGTFITKWGSYGTGDGQFNQPMAIAIDAAGDVYVADSHNHRIQVFDNAGAFKREWGSFGTTGDGKFYYPSELSIDAAGDVYVADTFNHRIQVFDNYGTFITKWGSYGSGPGQFRNPNGIAFDAAGNIYVSEDVNHRIQVFDNYGTFITKWGSYGSGPGFFKHPVDILVNTTGIHVIDLYNQRIQVFEGDFDGDGIPDDEDFCPNEDASGFDVDVDGCIDSFSGLTGILTTLVDEGVIAEELQISLIQKVNNALNSADKEKICAAINKLEALMNEVDAQTGKKISAEAAADIIAYTESTISYLQSQLPVGNGC